MPVLRNGRLRVTLDGRSYTVDTSYYKGVREPGNHYRVLLFSRGLTCTAQTLRHDERIVR